MPWSYFFECWVLSQFFHSPLSLSSRGSLVPLHFCHEGSVICISKVIDISPSNLDSSLCFLQPSISHDVLCILVKQAEWQYTALTYSLSSLEPVCCSMSSSNCCFLTCIQTSQEAGQAVWYSHLYKNFPHFVVIYTVKDFGIISKAEVDVFLELFWFFYDPTEADNLISGSSVFSKSNLNVWKFTVEAWLGEFWAVLC